ncbi:hypothetical protein PVAP13_5KG099261 [Panicum virgatum]|uniref:Uncharacterized protein n=1 Tax=Panicum virgatum TaxID=38727 RepID=A0A8T0S9E2_PANVG|nr:hypothetical protein PVAP13_5KG099261 [Panicum virgatum]
MPLAHLHVYMCKCAMFTRFNGSGSWLDLIHVRVYMHVISVVDASISIVSLLTDGDVVLVVVAVQCTETTRERTTNLEHVTGRRLSLFWRTLWNSHGGREKN